MWTQRYGQICRLASKTAGSVVNRPTTKCCERYTPTATIHPAIKASVRLQLAIRLARCGFVGSSWPILTTVPIESPFELRGRNNHECILLHDECTISIRDTRTALLVYVPKGIMNASGMIL